MPKKIGKKKYVSSSEEEDSTTKEDVTGEDSTSEEDSTTEEEKPTKKTKANTCAECKKTCCKTLRLNPFYDVRLCPTCEELDEYKIYFKTAAKQKFFLTDKDLADCPCVEKPHHTYNSIMVFYSYLDLCDIFAAKYNVNAGNKAAIEDMIETLEQKKSDRKEKLLRAKRQAQAARKKELVALLKTKRLELRADSKLCENYIKGENDDYWTPRRIVRRMCQMKYLYEYCNYKKHLNNAYEECRYDYDFRGRERIDYIESIAEENALKSVGLKDWPTKWPWLRRSDPDNSSISSDEYAYKFDYDEDV